MKGFSFARKQKAYEKLNAAENDGIYGDNYEICKKAVHGIGNNVTLEYSEIDLTELSNGQCVDSRIYPQLQKMFDDMRDDGVYPVVASGYRTEQEQQQIYDESMAEYIEKGYSESDAKTETERWVAIPGTSEHQLGLGVDINADGINSYGYEVYNWLAQNAYRYGFIYRYPENKVAITGIANEPWHYRYVGVNAATEIYKRGICLEEYLGETN